MTTTTLKLSEDVIPMSEFREGLAGFIKQTQESRRPMLITQNGHAAAVLMDSVVFDELREKLNELAVYEDILVSEGQSARGKMMTMEELEKRMNEREKTWRSRNPRTERVKEKTDKVAMAV